MSLASIGGRACRTPAPAGPRISDGKSMADLHMAWSGGAQVIRKTSLALGRAIAGVWGMSKHSVHEHRTDWAHAPFSFEASLPEGSGRGARPHTCVYAEDFVCCSHNEINRGTVKAVRQGLSTQC